MIYRAKHDSYGYGGIYWKAGDHTVDIPDEEVTDEILSHFEPVGQAVAGSAPIPSFTYGNEVPPETATPVLAEQTETPAATAPVPVDVGSGNQ